MFDQIEGKWFKSFAAVYEHKSISKAAEQLGYVQSTLTTHIQLLERVCGRKLFNRLPRGVEPTEAGVELSHYANQFLQLGEAMNEALQAHTVAKGTVKLQVLESFCVSYMPSVFELFFEQFPQVQLELTTGFYKDTLEALLERRIHIGIVPKNPERDDIDFHPLVEEELIFIAAPALSMRVRDAGLPADRKVIGFGSRCIYQSIAHEAMMQEWDVHPYKSLEYASLEMIKQTVMSGQGIALVPKIAVQSELQSGRLDRVTMKNNIFVTHGIISWKDKVETAAAKALKQTIIDRF
ncbi:LysR family transcriptional regulator [Paenibacillus radicis (ex Xue et al. 2023)]|uniref:LysR family transcriptional regulator n=1 Tax=Paenibacillus radicis (ex Xue et al. 2023) TaxID=2972489 RepID=A0ABT1YRE3_9BACL|nr:LysR family transcriptional regulator [Paenibacillus radicis (ex Xue et al. 2023)]MCR8634545.1 LysR family transcriptional regulator [Paenibacillus radicis (ex Xue et al. 2023)]